MKNIKNIDYLERNVLVLTNFDSLNTPINKDNIKNNFGKRNNSNTRWLYNYSS